MTWLEKHITLTRTVYLHGALGLSHMFAFALRHWALAKGGNYGSLEVPVVATCLLVVCK
jgi:hypothetical protein